MIERRLVASGSPYEAKFGFSRAVRVGDRVVVSATAPIWPDGACDPDPYVQAKRILEIVFEALGKAGAAREHVIRTRWYVTRPEFIEEVGRAHGEAFRDVRPANGAIVVTGFVDPRWKVEMEAEAVLG